MCTASASAGGSILMEIFPKTLEFGPYLGITLNTFFLTYSNEVFLSFHFNVTLFYGISHDDR